MKKLGFGFMRLPMTTNENGRLRADMEQVKAMVDLSMERGFTFFDTAYMYHEFMSEIYLRDALVRRYPRENFTISTKLPLMFLRKEGDQEAIFEEQLTKCEVDYFDYYLLHNLSVTNLPKAEKYKSFEFINRMKQEGKVKQIGFSFHDDAKTLEKILTEHPEVDVVQLSINYYDWENIAIQTEECYKVARKFNKPILVMEAVKGGSLSVVPEVVEKLFKSKHPDWTMASWAMRFAASLEGVETVLSGMSSLEHLKDNISFMDDFKPLNDEDLAAIDLAFAIMNEYREIPCTNCGECARICMKSIPVPQYFALYNSEKASYGDVYSNNPIYYSNLAMNHGRATDCLGCKKCEKVCPQHISIAENMKKVAVAFEMQGEK